MHTRIGFVLDGLDEYDSKNNSFFVDLIMGKIFVNALIVCTSRPTVTLQLHGSVDRRIEILGLPKEEQNNYIEISLSGLLGKKEELDKYLTRNPIIKSLCNVPLHLAILLYLFKQGSLPETLTEINESFIIHTIYRNLEKNGISVEAAVDKVKGLPKQIYNFVCRLSEIAYNGLNKHKIVFTFDEVKEICPDIMEMPGAINGFGLLQAVQHYPEVGVGKTMSFNFLHFTMQEFLAAHFVSTLCNEKQLHLIKNTFWNQHYEFMWMMYVGIVDTHSEVFLKFINSENLSDIQNNKRKYVHLLQFFSEAKSNQIPDKIFSLFDKRIEFYFMRFTPYQFWALLSFMYKSDMHTRYITLDFKLCFLDTDQMNLLYQFVINNPEKTSTLEYVNLSLGMRNVSPWNVFCAVIRNSLVHNLTLCGEHSFNDYHARDLVASLSSNTTLHSLTLIVSSRIELFELHSIKNVLVNANTSLKELNLSWGSADIEKLLHRKVIIKNNSIMDRITLNILDDGKKIISCADCTSDLSCKGLRGCPISILSFGLEGRNNIKRLDISWCDISSDGVEAIRNCLRNNNTLLELNMSYCHISNESIAKIIDASRKLQVLNVSNNYSNYVDAKNATQQELCMVAEAIGKNTSLQELNISHNNLQDDGSMLIAEQLKFNETLQCLNISANRITNIGAVHIAEALYVCTSLHELNISKNRITYEGVVVLLDYTEVNKTLKTLWITHNDITKTGISYIGSYILGMHSPLVIHISWNEVVVYHKQFHVAANYVSLNTGARSDNVITAHDSILITSCSDDADYEPIFLSNCLKDNDSLQEFDLSCTVVCNRDMELKRVIEVLKVNRTLVEFNLSNCHLSTKEIMALSDSLIHNNTLEKLSIAWTGITSYNFMMIINALRLNSTLVKLDVSWNKGLHYDNAASISSYLQNNVTLKKLNLESTCITAHHIKEIMKALSMNITLQKLVISCNPIYDAGAISISNCLQCNNSLKVLCMSNCTISSVGAIKIAEALKTNTALQKLDISFNEAMNDDSLVKFSTFLNDNHTLKKLNISMFQIYSVPEEVLQAVIQNCVMLEQLDLSHHTFNDKAVTAICGSIERKTTIKKLRISHCSISSSGIKNITEALISFSHSLRKLDISSNNLSNSGAEAIGEYLKNESSVLYELDLSYNEIGMVGGVKLAEGLKVNTVLRKLDISNNFLSDEGAIAFGDCLKTNFTLVKLDLSFNCITVKSMTIFAETIQVNKGLHTLKLASKDISNDSEDERIFCMTIMHAMYMNNTIMKLKLPGSCMYSENWSNVLEEVDKVNEERHKDGIALVYIQT